MNAEIYEAWYAAPRGQWIGSVEYGLLRSLLQLTPGSSLLDIGCGTGHFTREFVRENNNGLVVGLDPNQEWLVYANTHSANREHYVVGLGESIPFSDRSFDFTLSVTALSFLNNQVQVLRELVRVTRKRFVLGLLNRHSLLYLKKGRRGGTGAYQDAIWHTPSQIRELLAFLPVESIRLRTAIVLPQATMLAKVLERFWPRSILLGGFLAVSGDIVGDRERSA